MKFLYLGLLLSTSIILSGCAIGPLVSFESARSVGSSKIEILGGYGDAGYSAKLNYGLAKSWDIGVQIETLSVGARTKYAIFNNGDKGWSLAAALGLGASFGGSHSYGDLMVSHMSGWWEPYATYRYVKVQNDPVEFRDTRTGELNFTIQLPNYRYGQIFVGSRFWLNKQWMFVLEASTIHAIGSGLKTGDIYLVNGAFGYQF